MVPFPSRDYVHPSVTLSLENNAIFTGADEADGEGWVKIPGNATVTIQQGNPPPRPPVDARAPEHAYMNAGSLVQVVQWPVGKTGKSVSALAFVSDTSAGVHGSP